MSENVTEKIKQEIVRIDQLIVKKQKEMNELQKVLMIEPAKINILGDTYEELRNEIKQLGEKLKEHKQKLQENWLFFPLELVVKHFWYDLLEWSCSAIIPFCEKFVQVKS